MARIKATFEGYGTPIVLIFDHNSRLLLDLRAESKDSYDIALEKFSYAFQEKEEDKCTISLSSSRLDLMDDTAFFVGQKLRVSWGYLNGDINPPIEVMITNLKEGFTTKGFELTIEASDNFSVLSSGVNPTMVALQAKLDTFKPFHKSLQQDVQVDRVDHILYSRSAETWALAKAKVNEALRGTIMDDEQREIMTNSIIEEETKARTINADQRRSWKGYDDDQAALVTDEAKKQFARHVNMERFSPGVLNALVSAVGADPNFNWAKTLESKDIIGLQPEYGNHFYVTGNNPLTIAQNTANKVSVTPKQVTGRNGKAITYDKRRALAASAVTTYIWKAEDGRLLEFTYDTNSKYSDDNSVLSQFTVDPETGAITRRDYIKEINMNIEDTDEPNRFYQVIQDAKLATTLSNIQAGGYSMEAYLLNAPGSRMHDYGDGRLGGYMTNPNFNDARPSQNYDVGVTPQLNMEEGLLIENRDMATDEVAIQQRSVSVPTMAAPFDEESLQNEMKALKQGDGEQVKATARILGDPQLFSGINVNFLGIGKKRSGKYFLTSVTHDISPGSGYIMTTEGYLAATQATGIGTVTRTIKKEDIKTKAETIKAEKVKVSPNAAEIKARGYYLPTDFSQTPMEAEMFKKDKNWAIQIPGTFYEVNIFDSQTNSRKSYKIKVPIDPVTGTQQYPYKVFGDDLFYNLLGRLEDIRDVKIRKLNESTRTAGEYKDYHEYQTIR